MRKRIYDMVNLYGNGRLNSGYKYFMIVVILLSLLPLTLKETTPAMRVIEVFCLVVYVVDYILGIATADYLFDKKKWTSFAKYPFKVISVIDLLSIVSLVNSIIGLDPVFRIFNFRIMRIFIYSKNVRRICGIFKRAKKAFLSVAGLAAGYILISAIIMFNIEPDMFATFVDAVYWSTISLTTIGYGDLAPITAMGRILAVVSSFLGVAIVALPTGVVAAEYMNSFNDKD